MTADISALMDGELDPDQTVRVLGALRQDMALRETWATYHLIGDALRKSGPLSLDVSAAVARRLAEEPTALAPRRAPWKPKFSGWALAASVAAFGFVGLLAWQLSRVDAKTTLPGPAQLAQRTAPALTPAAAAGASARQAAPGAAEKPPLPAAEAEVYLLAHQEFSPSYAMVGMPVYVRVVAGDTGQ